MVVYTQSDSELTKNLKLKDFFATYAERLLLYKRRFDDFDQKLCFKLPSLFLNSEKRLFELASSEPQHIFDSINEDLRNKNLFFYLR